jgi:hypothetical protein
MNLTTYSDEQTQIMKTSGRHIIGVINDAEAKKYLVVLDDGSHIAIQYGACSVYSGKSTTDLIGTLLKDVNAHRDNLIEVRRQLGERLGMTSPGAPGS